MSTRYVLTDYFDAVLKRAKFKRLADGSFAGRIVECPGLLVFGDSTDGCRKELRATLEEWVLLGLKLGHPLPVIHSSPQGAR
jgi:predicted RNase H-like HicB family nuclease